MKRIVLSIITIAFAVSCALASFFADEQVFIRAKAYNNPHGPTQCLNTGETCDARGTLACRVMITVQTGSDIATSTGMYKTYRPSSECLQILLDDESSLKLSIYSINRLVED